MLSLPFKVLRIIVCPVSRASLECIRGTGAILKLADTEDDLADVVEV